MKSKLYFGLILLALLFSVCEKTEAQSPDWLWAKGMGGTGSTAAVSLVVDSRNGDVYTTGTFDGTVDFDPGLGIFNLTPTGYYDIFISKVDANGNFEWAKKIGGDSLDQPMSLAFDPVGNGSVYITGEFQRTVDFNPGKGTFNLTSSGSSDIFISKLDGSGNFVWAKTIGGKNKDEGRSIAVDPAGSGNVYIGGIFNSISDTVDFDPGAGIFNLTGYGIFISKFDSSGNFIWAKGNGVGNSYCNSIAIDPLGSGDIYSTGYFSGTVDFDPDSIANFSLVASGVHDIFISKLDGSGNFEWAKGIGGTDQNGSESITLDLSGSENVYTTGYFQGTVDFDPGAGIFNLTGAGFYNTFISKLDSSGNFVWAKALDGKDYNVGLSITIDHAGSGDVYTTGGFAGATDFDPDSPAAYNLTSIGDDDIFVCKFDSSGNFVWAKAIGGKNNDVGTSAGLDGLGHVYVAGNFASHSVSFDTTTLSNAGGNDIFIAKLDTTFTVPVVEIKTLPITIYPNPATNELTIKFDENGILNVGIIIFNILGEVVYSNQNEFISHQKTINISSLSTGIYFIELNINGNKLMQKVVKE